MKNKKAIIVISLVEESTEATNEEIEKEILEELSKDGTIVPWLKKVEKVTVA
jgi:DNA-binding PadR family transcriptional regulator